MESERWQGLVEPAYLAGRAAYCAVAVCLSLSPCFAAAPVPHRVLTVGPGAQFEKPSTAAIAARFGDTIEIAPGTYIDCAVWRAGSLTVEGAGNGPVVLADKVCENKALFVIEGDDVTVRNITFTGAKARAHNGAGIRAEGRNLTVENAKFVNNEEGILAGPLAGSTIVVLDSYFKGNGNCIAVTGCAHGIYVNGIDRLLIERCTFIEQHIGHHVKSRAARTELIDDTIEDGPNGTASYLVDIPNGGALLMRNNTLEKGPNSDNYMAAVILGEEGVINSTPEIIIENNRFANDMGRETDFVRNLTGTMAVLRGNSLSGMVQPLEELKAGQ